MNNFYLEAQHLFYLMDATGLRAKIQEIYLPAMNIGNAASYITQYNSGTYSIKNYLHLRSALLDMNIEVWDTLFCYGMETIRLYQEPAVAGSNMPLTAADYQWFQRLLTWFINIYKLETKTLA